MIKLKRKQVKGVINILISPSTQGRDALRTMRICRDGYAYITNGYVAVRFKLEASPEPKDLKQKEFVIPVENLIRWYKLAKTHDYLDELSILELEDKNNDSQYPDMHLLFGNHMSTAQTKEEFLIDTDMIKQFSDCIDGSKIKVKTIGTGLYVKSLDNPDVDGLIMGLTN